MKKLIFVFLLVAALGYSQNVIDLSGFDFMNWGMSERMAFVSGYLNGTYMTCTLAYETGELSREAFYEIMGHLTSVRTNEDLVRELVEFYIETGRFEIPIAVAIIHRHKREDIPEWKGWIYEENNGSGNGKETERN